MNFCLQRRTIVCGGESLDQAHVPSEMASIGIAGPVTTQKQQQSSRREFTSLPGIAQPAHPNVTRLLLGSADEMTGASNSNINGGRCPCHAAARNVLHVEQTANSRTVASELHARRRASMAGFLGATVGPASGVSSDSCGVVYGGGVGGGLLSYPEVKLMAWQLARALKHLHDREIVHRDIRPANLLLEDAGVLKLADFGSARALRGDQQPRARGGQQPQSSRWRMAPEVLAGQSHSLSADIWSYGCTVAELAIGKPLFPGSSHADQLLQIMRFCCLPPYDPHDFLRKQLSGAAAGGANSGGHRGGCGSSSRDPHSQLVRLLESCLRLDPNDRVTADQVLNSPYFNDVHDLIRGTQLEAALLYDDNDATAETISTSAGGPPSAVVVASGSSAAAPPVVHFDDSFGSCASTATTTATTTGGITTTTTTGISGATTATTSTTGITAATCIISASGFGSSTAAAKPPSAAVVAAVAASPCWTPQQRAAASAAAAAGFAKVKRA
ncbi:hypothetical protein PLESTB_000365400 [Pleodorina starrii]|uniref:Protein kinase domain-containing protein n=1 Tax=Pleodorina starrii TaxID=330485 RepID=A0A9W6BE17_9CHLO|nr:hypothetical protein PLESTM_000029700 [Pleodorina starrii]GLC50313.1 hypothetical protein PLESTB_000365400 [Pleodorina starrii]GLC64303.1 hypothetical protein PLESTF_000147200 [Pleodorina starrii]